MNARTVGKVLGISAALAVSVPVVLAPGTALAWSGHQSSLYTAPQSSGYYPTPGEAYAYTYGATYPGYAQTNAYGSSTPSTSYNSAAGYTNGSAYYPTPAEARSYTYGSPYAFAPSPAYGGGSPSPSSPARPGR